MPRLTGANLAEHRERAWSSIRAAFDDLLKDRDIEHITLAEVAERAGMARNTLYNYAPDKGALLAAAAESAMAELAGRVDEVARDTTRTARARFLAGVEELLSALAADRGRLRLIAAYTTGPHAIGSPEPGRHAELIRETLVTLIRKAAADGDFRPSVNPDLTEGFVRATVVEAGLRLSSNRERNRQIIDETQGFLARALAP